MTMTEWYEEAAPADLDELLDMPLHSSGATRFELMVGEMIEQSDPVLGAQLYDDTLGIARERDPNDPRIVVATVFERESGALVSEVRVAWNSFFHDWVELVRLDLLEVAALECLAAQDDDVRAELDLEIAAGHVSVSIADDDADYAALSVDGVRFGRVHRTRLTR